MSGWKRSIAFVVVFLAVASGARYAVQLTPREEPPRGPQSREEVIAIVESLGLHYRSDRADGDLQTCRIFVSDTPLTWERVSDLTCRRVRGPEWGGIVAVYRTWKVDPGFIYDLATWGDHYVYGDPALIQKLMKSGGKGQGS